MAFFKKKNKVEIPSDAGKDTKQQVLEVLNAKLQGTLYDNCIIMPRGYTIDVQIGRNEEKEGIFLLQVIYIVKNDEFDEPIIDPVDSQGKSEEEAVNMSVEVFFGGLWHPIQQSLQKKNPIHVSVDYLRQHYDFDMYAHSIVRIGVDESKKPTVLLNEILQEIPKFLGSKKYYWIRIFLAKYKEKAMIEVRINGTICVTLHDKFKDYLASWGDTDTFMSEKQYAICVQREDDQCPFNKETVVNATKETIKLMEEAKTPEDFQAIMTKIEPLTDGNKGLAAEIRIFVPEVLAKLTMGYQEGDSLFLIEDDQTLEIKKTQLRSYYYIQQTMLEYLSKQPPKENVMKIVANSVAFRELKKAHEAGHEPKDLYVPGTSYKVAIDGYKVW